MAIDLKEIRKAASDYKQVAMTAFNRLEPSPRTNNFDRSLRAEVHDALWMLTRQWQMGEFMGADGGSPHSVNILATLRQPTQLRLPGLLADSPDDDVTLPLGDLPLETLVEREEIAPDLWLRVQMGRQWRKMLASAGFQKYDHLFLGWYPLSSAPATDDTDAVELLTATQGLLPDGWLLYEESTRLGTDFEKFIDRENDIAAPDRAALKALVKNFQAWFQRLYNQPAPGKSAWQPRQLEYQFSLDFAASAPTQFQLVADQYDGGALDWFALDERIKGAGAAGISVSVPGVLRTEAFLPSPASFAGMPQPRFWEMEDGRVNFGKIEASRTGLFSMLLADYGLLYSNDWFVVPYPLDVNTLCEVQGLVVSDVFGQNFLVLPALQDPENNWQQQAFFHHTEREHRSVQQSRFYLPPALAGRLESEPLERVHFIRDEMANLVWAIEQILPAASGGGREVKQYAFDDDGAAPLADGAVLRYQLGNWMPANWIPFVPVQTGNSAEIMLQRASFPGNPGPQGAVLRQNLAPDRPVYLLNEEEVPRSGVTVERSFQRTRWLNGRTFCWVGRKKSAGRGEGRSGLAFDQAKQ